MGVAGRTAPTATTLNAARVSGRLGWLRKNGTRRVRMAKMTSVWVARDSTNQPERNSAACAWKTHSMTAKVRKSNTELSGPNTIMNRRMKPMSQCEGRCSCSSSTLSVGNGELAGVVEQVVEQDLAGQHGQEGQEQRRAGGGEHVAEVAGGAHQHVLDGVGEDPPPLGHAVGEHVEVLLQQDHVS